MCTHMLLMSLVGRICLTSTEDMLHVSLMIISLILMMFMFDQNNSNKEKLQVGH